MKTLKIIAVSFAIALILNLVVTATIDRWVNNLPEIVAFKRIPQTFFWDFSMEPK